MTSALHLPGAPDYEAFARAQGPRLTRMVLRKLGDRGEAEDIAQEALLRAHKHWDEFLDDSSAAAWVTTVTQRLVIDRLRVRHRLVSVPELPETARLGRDTAEVAVGRQEARYALESLEALPNRQAAVLWAREVEGLSYDDIAARHGMTGPTVRSLLARGRKALRKEYASRGGTMPVGAFLPLPVLVALRALGKLKKAALAGGAATTAGLGLFAAAALQPAPALPMTELVPAVPVIGRSLPAPVRLEAPLLPPTAERVAPAAAAPERGAPQRGPAAPAATPTDTALPTVCAVRCVDPDVTDEDVKDPTIHVVLPPNPVVRDVGIDLGLEPTSEGILQ